MPPAGAPPTIRWSRSARIDPVPDDAGVLIVANPNNPDGRLYEPQRLLDLAQGRLLVVDEAFADVAPDISLAGSTGRRDVVVLRSFGKFFGLAGMRLGFALLAEPMASRLRRMLGSWAVSGPAAAVGAVALADAPWVRSVRVRLTAAAGRLDGLLMRSGLEIIGGTSLFRLVRHPRAGQLFEVLAGSAILVRGFAEHPQWLRFGLPGDDAGFERLGEALAAWRPQPAAPAAPMQTRVRAPAVSGAPRKASSSGRG